MKKKPKIKSLPQYRGGGLKKFGSYVGDGLRLGADNTMSAVGLGNVIQDDDYKNVDMRNVSKVTGKIAGAALPIAATFFGGPAAGMAVRAGQNAIGGFNPESTGEETGFDKTGNAIAGVANVAGMFMGGGKGAKVPAGSLAGGADLGQLGEARMYARNGGIMKYPKGGRHRNFTKESDIRNPDWNTPWGLKQGSDTQEVTKMNTDPMSVDNHLTNLWRQEMSNRREQKTGMQNSIPVRTSNYTPVWNYGMDFENGGMSKYPMGEANAEVEGGKYGEIVTSNRQPIAYSGGNINMVSNNPYGIPSYKTRGNTHENGGIQTNLASGSIINGKTINPITKNLFTVDMDKLTKSENKYTKLKERGDKGADEVLKMLAIKKNDLNALQQSIIEEKAMKAHGRFMAKYGGVMNYKNGGVKLPKFGDGDKFDIYGNPIITMADESQNSPSSNPIYTNINGQSIPLPYVDNSISTPNPYQGQKSFGNTPNQNLPDIPIHQSNEMANYKKELARLTNKRDPYFGSVNYNKSNAKSFNPAGNSSDKYGTALDVLGNAAGVMGELYALGTNKPPETYNYTDPRTLLKQYDPTHALNESARMAKAADYNAKNVFAGNQGAALGYYAQAGANNAQQRAGVVNQYDQANIGAYNQLALPTAQLATQRAIHRQEDVTANRDFKTAQVGKIGSKIQSGVSDYKKTGQDQDYLTWLKQMYPKAWAAYPGKK